MMSNIQIVPAILATTEEEYREILKKIESCPELAEGLIQIDLMDKKFVANESIKPEVIGRNPTKLKQEAHLMVEYPENWIDELIKTDVDRIIFPVEDIEGIEERINHIKNHGKQVGLSLNPETQVQKVQPFVVKLDVVLVMAVNPGFGGQEFIPEVLEKIKEIKDKTLDVSVGVDGGVTPENAKLIVDAGADYLVVGSHLLEGNIDENLGKFKQALQNSKS